MKKEFDGLTINVDNYLVTVIYDKNRHFSEDLFNTARKLLHIAFPLYEIRFKEKNNETDK